MKAVHRRFPPFAVQTAKPYVHAVGLVAGEQYCLTVIPECDALCGGTLKRCFSPTPGLCAIVPVVEIEDLSCFGASFSVKADGAREVHWHLLGDERQRGGIVDGRLSFGGLRENTEYVLSVRALCENGAFGVASHITFRTLPCAPCVCADREIRDLKAVSLKPHEAFISWTFDCFSEVELQVLRNGPTGAVLFEGSLPPGTTEYVVVNLPADTVLYIAVRGVCSSDATVWSVTSVQTPPLPTACESTEPRNFAYHVAIPSDTYDATLTWEYDDTVAAWEIQKKIQNGEWEILGTLPRDARSFVAESLTSGIVYHFQVRGVCEDGGRTKPASLVVQEDVECTETVPHNFHATATQGETWDASLEWEYSGDGVENWEIECAPAPQIPPNKLTPSKHERNALFKGLIEDVTYEFTLRGVCTSGRTRSTKTTLNVWGTCTETSAKDLHVVSYQDLGDDTYTATVSWTYDGDDTIISPWDIWIGKDCRSACQPDCHLCTRAERSDRTYTTNPLPKGETWMLVVSAVCFVGARTPLAHVDLHYSSDSASAKPTFKTPEYDQQGFVMLRWHPIPAVDLSFWRVQIKSLEGETFADHIVAPDEFELQWLFREGDIHCLAVLSALCGETESLSEVVVIRRPSCDTLSPSNVELSAFDQSLQVSWEWSYRMEDVIEWQITVYVSGVLFNTLYTSSTEARIDGIVLDGLGSDFVSVHCDVQGICKSQVRTCTASSPRIELRVPGENPT